MFLGLWPLVHREVPIPPLKQVMWSQRCTDEVKFLKFFDDSSFLHRKLNSGLYNIRSIFFLVKLKNLEVGDH